MTGTQADRPAAEAASCHGDEAERCARAVWSRIAEPGDAVAHLLVNEAGAAAALERVGSGRTIPFGAGAREGSRRPVGATDLARWRVRLDGLDPRWDQSNLAAVGGRVVIPGDDEWPPRLDDLGPAAPFCLWVRGERDLAALTEHAVSVVGARAATGYGEFVAGELGIGCGSAGFTVVSGAAYGVDGAAHRGALDTPGGTLAVLACGVDRPYPRGHETLLGRIAADGLVVSEVPPGSAPTRWRFLQRNRLIAAVSGVTVVVEAAARSGALGTARRAADLGRLVAAVPGPVTSGSSVGCHQLLRAGATCVTSAEEVLELLRPLGEQLRLDDDAVLEGRARSDGPTAVHDGLSPELLRLLDAVPKRRWSMAASIARTAGSDPALALSGLGRLEARGLVARSVHGWRRSGT
jgi:DNA processing protein